MNPNWLAAFVPWEYRGEAFPAAVQDNPGLPRKQRGLPSYEQRKPLGISPWD
ncbi:MAG: hypothetical protein HY681_11215 [Chloroflexi bacterium]|nr:hypothetical protein [Chloroflexota bacterium]